MYPSVPALAASASDSFEKSSHVLGSEAWEEYSSGLFKDFVLNVWEERKVRL